MQRDVCLQALFHDGHQDIDRDGDPYLRLHGVLGCAEKGLDTQMLLDPLEEQLDLPPALVGAPQANKGAGNGRKTQAS